MKRGKSDAETCAINGWTVGTILIGRPRPSTPAPVPGRVADPTRDGHNRNDAPLIVVRGDEP